MMTIRQLEIWRAWIELLKAEGIDPPDEEDLSKLDVWCPRSTKDGVKRKRAPYKAMVLNSMDGTLDRAEVSKRIRGLKQFRILEKIVGEASLPLDDTEMLKFCKRRIASFDRDLRGRYDKLPDTKRAILIERYHTAKRLDSKLHYELEIELDSWIGEWRADLESMRRSFEEEPELNDEEIDSSLSTEEGDLEDLQAIRDAIVERRIDIQRNIAFVIRKTIMLSGKASPPAFNLDNIEDEMANDLRVILGSIEEKSIVEVGQSVEDLKQIFDKHVKKAHTLSDLITERGEERRIALMGAD